QPTNTICIAQFPVQREALLEQCLCTRMIALLKQLIAELRQHFRSQGFVPRPPRRPRFLPAPGLSPILDRALVSIRCVLLYFSYSYPLCYALFGVCCLSF